MAENAVSTRGHFNLLSLELADVGGLQELERTNGGLGVPEGVDARLVSRRRDDLLCGEVAELGSLPRSDVLVGSGAKVMTNCPGALDVRASLILRAVVDGVGLSLNGLTLTTG